MDQQRHDRQSRAEHCEHKKAECRSDEPQPGQDPDSRGIDYSTPSTYLKAKMQWCLREHLSSTTQEIKHEILIKDNDIIYYNFQQKLLKLSICIFFGFVLFLSAHERVSLSWNLLCRPGRP